MQFDFNGIDPNRVMRFAMVAIALVVVLMVSLSLAVAVIVTALFGTPFLLTLAISFIGVYLLFRLFS
ncbi:hypothetical protein [Micromonospora coerulea]|uniref:hypothetical protein n=1 Tax=Micromonospora coerulea TaxID=47856 RepID=UPI0019079900|nr:hypothetical protein [Micromonospora veneta]